jgi:transposase-like protein
MRNGQDTAIEALMEQLIANGSEDMGVVFASLFDLAMRIERERFLGAEHYERTPSRRGYANGTKPKRLDTPAGTLTVNVPKTAGHDEPFYPASLERGRRSTRAVLLAVAEMYVKGVSTREVEAVMCKFGIESLSSSQVSRAARLLDDELEAWRARPLGEIRYLFIDARYEKARLGGVVRDAAVLSAIGIGIGPDERRRVPGVSIALSEAEVRWRAFGGEMTPRIISFFRLTWKACRRAACAASNTSFPTITPVCARRAAPSSAARSGSAASSILHKTPSTTRPARASASALAPISAPSGTPTPSPKPKPR